MCNSSLDMLGFVPEMVFVLATDVYATKMLIDEGHTHVYSFGNVGAGVYAHGRHDGTRGGGGQGGTRG